MNKEKPLLLHYDKSTFIVIRVLCVNEENYIEYTYKYRTLLVMIEVYFSYKYSITYYTNAEVCFSEYMFLGVKTYKSLRWSVCQSPKSLELPLARMDDIRWHWMTLDDVRKNEIQYIVDNWNIGILIYCYNEILE